MYCDVTEPHSLDEALHALSTYGKDGRAIAGGQSLLVMLRNRLISPKILVGLESLEDLRDIKKTRDGQLTVGAMVTCSTLMMAADIAEEASILAEAAGNVASTPIRNLGTIGGNLSHNELGADLPPPLLVLNAEADCQSMQRSRSIRLEEFFRHYFTTALDEGELLCRVRFPRLPRDASSIYIKHAVRREDVAIVSVAAVLIPDTDREGRYSELRLALGGVAPVPFRARKAESLLDRSTNLSNELIEEIADQAAKESDPGTDADASADYRRKMVRVFVRRAIVAAEKKIKKRRG